MRRILLAFAALIGAFSLTFGQTVLEDFESGTPTLPWNASFGDGVLTVVDNPADSDPLGINPSAKVGSYQKEVGKSYSLLIAVLDNPLDLSTNNQFRVQVNAPVATRFLLKLEGTGESIQEIKNIAVTNKWIEYTFDFSGAAALTTINKIILFFDPDVADSGDTYLFDNLIMEPAGPCAGTVPDPLILDDFECQRNGTYGDPGYSDVTVIDNPDASGINTSSKVGKYTDPPGPWNALVYDWNSAAEFPLTKEGSSIVKIKVWAPVAGVLKFKLEGGASPSTEIDAQVTELNSWVEYSADFSAQIGASHRKLAIFFNAGVDPGAADVYYFDDARLEAAPTGNVLEDFEPQKLFWESLGDEAIFGTFNGPLANPAPNGVNDSPNAGKYTKGSSALGGLKATLPVDFSIAAFPQLNLQVWAPAGADEFVLKLSSPTQGLKSVSQPIPATGEWVQLNFNFADFTTITDFEQVELSFDPGLATTDVWYFDNLSQGEGTIDPCADVEPIPNIVDDFDCQRNASISLGADKMEVVPNPFPGGPNPDPLDKIGKYTDPLDEWSALVYDFGGPVDLSFYNQLEVLIWSPKIVPLLFKLEGGTTGQVEKFIDVTAANGWVKYVIDFSEHAGSDNSKLAIFFNAGQTAMAGDLYYIDDLKWSPAPYRGCIATFETPELTISNWRYFSNGSLDDIAFTPVPNPAKDGVNGSETVGISLEATDGATFAGMFADPPAPIAMSPNNKTITMKVWMDHNARVVMKMERGVDGAPGSGDTFAEYNNAGKWQELTWDFSALPDNAQYQRITLIFDIDNIPTETKTYYFDDISVGGAACGLVGVFSPVRVGQLQIAPNPVRDLLTVTNATDARFFRIFNAFGQQVGAIQTVMEDATANIDVSALSKGLYVLAAYDRQGRLTANAKFIKQ